MYLKINNEGMDINAPRQSNSRNIGLDGAAAMGWYEREGSNLCCWSRKEFVVRVSLIVTIAVC